MSSQKREDNFLPLIKGFAAVKAQNMPARILGNPALKTLFNEADKIEADAKAAYRKTPYYKIKKVGQSVTQQRAYALYNFLGFLGEALPSVKDVGSGGLFQLLGKSLGKACKQVLFDTLSFIRNGLTQEAEMDGTMREKKDTEKATSVTLHQRAGLSFSILLDWFKAGLTIENQAESELALIFKKVCILLTQEQTFASSSLFKLDKLYYGQANKALPNWYGIAIEDIKRWIDGTMKHGAGVLQLFIQIIDTNLSVLKQIEQKSMDLLVDGLTLEELVAKGGDLSRNLEAASEKFTATCKASFSALNYDALNAYLHEIDKPAGESEEFNRKIQAQKFAGLDTADYSPTQGVTQIQASFKKSLKASHDAIKENLQQIIALHQQLQSIEVPAPEDNLDAEARHQHEQSLNEAVKRIIGINMPEDLPSALHKLISELHQLKQEKLEELKAALKELRLQSGAAIQEELAATDKQLSELHHSLYAQKDQLSAARESLFALVREDDIEELVEAKPEASFDAIKSAIAGQIQQKQAELRALTHDFGNVKTIDKSIRILHRYVTCHLTKTIPYKFGKGSDPKQKRFAPWPKGGFDRAKISDYGEKVMAVDASFYNEENLPTIKEIKALENFDPATQTILIRFAAKANGKEGEADVETGEVIVEADFEAMLKLLFTPQELRRNTFKEYYDCTNSAKWNFTNKSKLMGWAQTIFERIPATLRALTERKAQIEQAEAELDQLKAKQEQAHTLLDATIPAYLENLGRLEERHRATLSALNTLRMKSKAATAQQAEEVAREAQLLEETQSQLQSALDAERMAKAREDQHLEEKQRIQEDADKAETKGKCTNREDKPESKQTKPIFKWNWKIAFKVALVIGIILGVATAGTFGGLMIFGAKTLVAEKILFGLSYLGKLIATQFANLPAAVTIAMNAVIDLVLPVATVLTLIAVPWSIATLCHEEAVNASSTSNFSGSGSYDAFSEEDSKRTDADPAETANTSPLQSPRDSRENAKRVRVEEPGMRNAATSGNGD